MINREELAWAAGFFDGEGNTNTTLSRRWPTIKMSINQVKDGPLQRFHAVIGGLGKIHQRPRSKNKNAQPQKSWSVTNWRDCQAVYAMLWGFLSQPKKEQILEQVRKYREGREWGTTRGKWTRPPLKLGSRAAYKRVWRAARRERGLRVS